MQKQHQQGQIRTASKTFPFISLPLINSLHLLAYCSWIVIGKNIIACSLWIKSEKIEIYLVLSPLPTPAKTHHLSLSSPPLLFLWIIIITFRSPCDFYKKIIAHNVIFTILSVLHYCFLELGSCVCSRVFTPERAGLVNKWKPKVQQRADCFTRRDPK